MTDDRAIENGPIAPEVDETTLSAFLDGALEGEERRRVADAIERDRRLGQQAAAFQGVDMALRRYADVLREAEPPARLCIRRMAAERRDKRLRRTGIVLACLLLVGLGVAGGWVGHGLFHQQEFMARTFVEEAASAHHVYVVEVRHPVEVAEAERAHLTKWLSKRLAEPIAAPDLSGVGFQLVGGRLLPARAGAPAAQLMYEDADGARITLYAKRNSGGRETAFKVFRPAFSDAETVYWLERDVAYGVSGAVGRETLFMLANAVLKGLDGA